MCTLPALFTHLRLHAHAPFPSKLFQAKIYSCTRRHIAKTAGQCHIRTTIRPCIAQPTVSQLYVDRVKALLIDTKIDPNLSVPKTAAPGGKQQRERLTLPLTAEKLQQIIGGRPGRVDMEKGEGGNLVRKRSSTLGETLSGRSKSLEPLLGQLSVLS